MLSSLQITSPVGPLVLVAGENGLQAVLWGERDKARVGISRTIDDGSHPVLTEAARQLEAYFAGGRTAFDLPLDPHGTAFQQRVWAELRGIPFGETRSYAALAHALGDVRLVRAVGAANGRNPISIIVPCHRVIGSNRALVGFAGGLDVKAKLLALEGHRLDPAATRIASEPQLELFASRSLISAY